jgi:cbb3-type cytochrome oxidase maturation protein
MDSLYLLIPLSVVLVLLIGGLLAWSVMSGQFEDLDAEASRILDEDADAIAPAPDHESDPDTQA